MTNGSSSPHENGDSTKHPSSTRQKSSQNDDSSRSPHSDNGSTRSTPSQKVRFLLLDRNESSIDLFHHFREVKKVDQLQLQIRRITNPIRGVVVVFVIRPNYLVRLLTFLHLHSLILYFSF